MKDHPSTFGGPEGGQKPLPKEQTLFNMALLDFNEIDRHRQIVHQFYLSSVDNPYHIFLSYEALKQMFVIFQWTLDESLMKTTLKKFEKFTDLLNKNNQVLTNRRASPEVLAELRQELYGLIQDVYRAKQIGGLGMPKTKMKDIESTIGEL